MLDSVAAGNADLGQFALFNSQAAFYEESLAAIGARLFHTREAYALPIRHALIAHPSAELADMDTVYTHREVLRQCKANLARLLPELTLEASSGDLLDPAAIGKALARGRLPRNVATISNARIAVINGLRILAEDLQDDPRNRSWFVLVERFVPDKR